MKEEKWREPYIFSHSDSCQSRQGSKAALLENPNGQDHTIPLEGEGP
jgi:hypothetical protein